MKFTVDLVVFATMIVAQAEAFWDQGHLMGKFKPELSHFATGF